jgi:hypothetical protein
MALDDILVDVGDWVGLMDELPAESLVTLPDIVTESGTNRGAALVEVPTVVAGGGNGISRSRTQTEQ